MHRQHETLTNMETQSTTPKVFKAMAAVAAALAGEGISKDQKNQHQRYKFRGIDQVYNTTSRLLADNGLVVLPRYIGREMVERKTRKGEPLFSVTVDGEYTFYCAEDGSSVTVGPFFGEAMDTNDKATNKAMSASYKYMIFQTFCVPTQGDGDTSMPTQDADSVTHEVGGSSNGSNGSNGSSETISGAQMRKLNASGKDRYGVDWTKKRAQLVHSVTKGRTRASRELTASEADRIIEGLNAEAN